MAGRSVTITLTRIEGGGWQAHLWDVTSNYMLLCTAEEASDAVDKAWRMYERRVLAEAK